MKYLQGILQRKVKQKIDQKYLHDYTLKWMPSGIDPGASGEHRSYLNKFCEDFYSDIKNMMESVDDERELRRKVFRKVRFYRNYNEVLHHLHFCNIKSRTFCGQENILGSVKEYILNSSIRKPLVIHAPSGNGKTSVMAMIMQNLPKWYNTNPYVGIIRFLGTSALSLDIYQVLLNICLQLAALSGHVMETVGFKNMKNLQDNMPRYFRRVSTLLQKPVVILLDSLDQLSPAHNAYELQWLPTTLPQNFKLVVSTLPKEHGILDNLRSMHPDENCYVEIPNLPLETGVAIIKKYLLKHDKKVTEKQEKLLMNTFSKCPGPLFLKLILEEALKWRSYTMCDQIELQHTVQGAINKLFDNMEVKFGKIVTSHALGYITIARDGISENELEDVLSCDDEALDDVYRYHNPPVEGIVRIPPVLAARIKFDIKDYIVESISHDKYTMNWYHRQFIETARNRYAKGSLGEKLHRNLVDMFMHENGLKRDITLSRRKLTVSNADRQITSQPVTWKNKRMLSCLPYHINHAGKTLSEHITKANCYCYFKFISSKLSAFDVETFLDELNEYLENQEDKEIYKLRNFLSLMKGNLSNPGRLAANILAFIDGADEELFLKKLREQSIKHLENLETPGLIPEFPALAHRNDLDSSLIYCYSGISEISSNRGEAILVKTNRAGNPENDEFPYELFRLGTQDFQQLKIQNNKEKEHHPLLDKAGKLVIYTSTDSVTLVHVGTGNKVTKSFKDITEKLCKINMVCKAMSADTCHLVVLLDDGSVLLLDTDSLMLVDRWNLPEKLEDVKGLLCTKSDNLQVLVSVNTETGGTHKSELQLFKPGDIEPKKFLFNFALFKNLQGLSYNESFFTAVALGEDSFLMLTVDINRAEEMSPIIFKDKIEKVVFSQSKPVACVLTNKGEVTVVNLQRGKMLFPISPDNPVSCFEISGTNDIVCLGDEEGNITLHNSKTGVSLVHFPAHTRSVEKMQVLDDYLVTHGQNELKVWTLPKILEDNREEVRKNTENICSSLLEQKTVSCFDLHPNGQELVTASKDQMLRVWMLKEGNFCREIDIGVKATKMVICADDICCILDIAKKLKVISLTSNKEVNVVLPGHAIDFVVGKDGITLYTVGLKQDTLMVSIVDLKQGITRKSFTLKGSLSFETLTLCLSDNERYLCFRIKILPSEFKDIETAWQKKGSFLSQVHPYKFMAVDLQQGTGGMVPCVRQLSKIPHLGEAICPNYGNRMLITTKRWVFFWDIPTGTTNEFLWYKCNTLQCIDTV